ncbi:hypothetical protein CRM22_003285 [Opisthorchis felineus]|uniref:Uncharacterized protein n=1 Tax=Opisthorchis felineus TaxID=147828 RepID=A0A4S2M237_OPIFE|nr:hypothetical protein CRM22_003285 [Opisthorchis felineus]
MAPNRLIELFVLSAFATRIFPSLSGQSSPLYLYFVSLCVVMPFVVAFLLTSILCRRAHLSLRDQPTLLRPGQLADHSPTQMTCILLLTDWRPVAVLIFGPPVATV